MDDYSKDPDQSTGYSWKVKGLTAPSFGKDLEIAYIPMKPPGFVGPMPQMILKEGKSYYPDYVGALPIVEPDAPRRFNIGNILDMKKPSEFFSDGGAYQKQAEQSDGDFFRGYFAELDRQMEPIWKTYPDCPHGSWPVSTQEVICCQNLHGGQDEMLKAMHKEDVYFYIYDASIPKPDPIYYDTGFSRETMEWIRNGEFKRGALLPLVQAYSGSERKSMLGWVESLQLLIERGDSLIVSLDSIAHFNQTKLTINVPGTDLPMIELESGCLGTFKNTVTDARIGAEMAKLLVPIDEDVEITPRNRAERRQGRRLDSSKKHKRKEWWNK